MAVLPMYFLYLPSAGLTTSIWQAASSSGRVVATGSSALLSFTLKVFVTRNVGSSSYSISASAMVVLQSTQ